MAENADMIRALLAGNGDMAPAMGDDVPAAMAAAAERTRRSVKPPGGRQEGALTALATGMADPFGVTSGVVGHFDPELADKFLSQAQGHEGAYNLGGMITPAVADMAVALGKTIAPTAANAGEHVDPRLGRINQLQQSIAKARDQMYTLGTTMTKSPPGTQKIAMDKLGEGITAQETELKTLMDQVDAENQKAAAADELKKKSEEGFRQRFPMVADVLPFAGPAFGYVTGKRIGKYSRSGRQAAANEWDKTIDAAEKQFSKSGGRNTPKGQQLTAELKARQAEGLPGGNYPVVGSALGGGLSGALESGVTQVTPELWNSETLPIGSPNQVTAQQNLRDPYWWLSRVAPAAGAGFSTGALGGAAGARGGGLKTMAPKFMGGKEVKQINPPTARTQGLLDVPDLIAEVEKKSKRK